MILPDRPAWFSEPCFLGIGSEELARNAHAVVSTSALEAKALLLIQMRPEEGLCWALWFMPVHLRQLHTGTLLESSKFLQCVCVSALLPFC